MLHILSKSARIMLIATLVSGFAVLGWTQSTNPYATGGDYSVGASTNPSFLIQMTTTNGLNPFGDNNLVWSHSGRYLATDRTPTNNGNSYVNLIGFGKTGSITNLGARSDTNDYIFPNITDFTWNDDRVLFVSPTPTPGPLPPHWLRIMSCTTTGATMTVTNFFSAPPVVSNHVYSPSTVFDPVIQKERLLFLVSNSTNSPPTPPPPPLDNNPSTTVNVYTVSYDRGSIPSNTWGGNIQPLTAFTNNIQIQSVKWCPELGTNFQPLVNRYAMLVQPPGPVAKQLYVFTGARDVITNPASAPLNLQDPRFNLRETNVCPNSQMSWTFDGKFLMYGVNVGTTSQLYSVSSAGPTNRVLFPTPGTNAFQNKQWLCLSPSGLRAAFTINKQLFLLPLQCGNSAASTNAGATNIITDSSYTRVVIPGSALPQTNGTLTNFSFSITEPTDVDTNNFPSTYVGNAHEFSVSGVDTQVNFTTNVEMSLHFDDSDVPAGVDATNMSIFLFNPTNVQNGYTGTWSQVQSTVDTNTHYVTSTNIQHFSIYALGNGLDADLPATPTGLSASKGSFTDRVRLAWSVTARAAGYEVWRNTANNDSTAVKLPADTTGTLFDDTSVGLGTNYYYWVKATNTAGHSDFSIGDYGYASQVIVAPQPPTGISASKGLYADRIRVIWNTSVDATSYEVYRNTDNDSATASKFVEEPTTAESDDFSAALGKSYYYWVKAKNAGGTSPFSASDSGFIGVVGPLITANGLVGDVYLNSGDPVTIAVQMMNIEPYVGTEVDWWIVARAGSFWYYLNNSFQWTPDGNMLNWHPVYQGGLFNLPAYEVLNITGLGTGSYTFYFAVDMPMDGILNLDGPILYDSVNVIIQ